MDAGGWGRLFQAERAPFTMGLGGYLLALFGDQKGGGRLRSELWGVDHAGLGEYLKNVGFTPVK